MITYTIGEIYHLKIVIGDDADRVFGSAIFLNAHSLSVIPDVSFIGFYPNPVKDSLYIKGKNSISIIKIISITGVVVLEQNIDVGDNLISLANIPSGIYMIQVNNLDWYKLVIE